MRVDFYLLSESNDQQKFIIACKLIEKAYKHGHSVFVYCDDEQQAHDIDELLWTFRAESFIPHNLQGEGPEPPPVVQIGYKDNAGNFNDVLLNLSQNIPQFFQRFRRILQIVEVDESAKEISRQHYRHYKAHGAKVFTNSLTGE